MTDLYPNDKRNRVVRCNIPLSAFLMFLHSIAGGKKVTIILTCQLSSAVFASCLGTKISHFVTRDARPTATLSFLQYASLPFRQHHLLARSACMAWRCGGLEKWEISAGTVYWRLLLLCSPQPSPSLPLPPAIQKENNIGLFSHYAATILANAEFKPGIIFHSLPRRENKHMIFLKFR